MLAHAAATIKADASNRTEAIRQVYARLSSAPPPIDAEEECPPSLLNALLFALRRPLSAAAPPAPTPSDDDAAQALRRDEVEAATLSLACLSLLWPQSARSRHAASAVECLLCVIATCA
jgi:hypothetical protein